MLPGATLPDAIAAILAARTPRPAPDAGARPAAVLVPLFFEGGDWQLLFTQRTETLAAHRGQISFPGGGRDAADASPLDTALRETEEEIGLARGDVRVLGQLDEMLTVVTGYRVWPFVGLIPYPYPFRPSPYEIAQLIPLPLAGFFDPANFEARERTIPDGRVVPVYYFHVGGHVVWGATAWMVRQLVDLIRPALDRASGPRS